MINRATYLPVPHVYNLSFACEALVDAWGHHVYLVGSSLERRDYRDVDVRMMLPDEEFDRLFPGRPWSLDARWSLMCVAISGWLSQQSGGLPVDFQFQRATEANADPDNQKRRYPLGIWRARVDRPKDEDRRLA